MEILHLTINEHVLMRKTAVYKSGNLSTREVLNRDYINPADGRPIYRPIKCQILALFSSADKK